ncbi:MAG: alanine racemase [Bdellovibrionales bacterium]
MFRPTAARVDTNALRSNLELLKSWNGAGFFCPMVKANAYGHGDLIVSRIVEQSGEADALGVALVEEGCRLRERGIRMPILVFGPLTAESAKQVLDFGLTPVMGCMGDLDALLRHPIRHRLKIHLKFNTGMQRLGFDAIDIPPLQSRLKAHAESFEVQGVCTHLSRGEDVREADGPTAKQLLRFQKMTAPFPGIRHVHKSASLCTLREETARTGLGSRPGIALYGLPFEGREMAPGLKPVLTWTTALVAVHDVEKGEGVSYGPAWLAPRRSRIGVVPVGYGDGYSRTFSDRGEMLFRGCRVPVVGRVCMDYTLLDLTESCRDGDAHTGEPVVIIGRQGHEEISAAELAETAKTISYEVVTAIGHRVAREAL